MCVSERDSPPVPILNMWPLFIYSFFPTPFCSCARVTEAGGDWALLAQRRRGSAPGMAPRQPGEPARSSRHRGPWSTQRAGPRRWGGSTSGVASRCRQQCEPRLACAGHARQPRVGWADSSLRASGLRLRPPRRGGVVGRPAAVPGTGGVCAGTPPRLQRRPSSQRRGPGSPGGSEARPGSRHTQRPRPGGWPWMMNMMRSGRRRSLEGTAALVAERLRATVAGRPAPRGQRPLGWPAPNGLAPRFSGRPARGRRSGLYRESPHP